MRLTRFSLDARETLGHLTDDENVTICCTLERPWLDNAQGVSCIPAGTYTCTRTFSPHFKREVFEIRGVPNRDKILIHWGNFAATDTEGCVLVGGSFADINADGVLDVSGSKATFERFMATMKGVDTFPLTVTNP